MFVVRIIYSYNVSISRRINNSAMRMRIAEYFGEISVKISRFQSRFQDFGQDFEISRKISRFHVRFQVFTKDFKISGEISRFHEDFKISRKISKISVEISARAYGISASGGPLGSESIPLVPLYIEQSSAPPIRL